MLITKPGDAAGVGGARAAGERVRLQRQLVAAVDLLYMRQYLYVCTSKASKVSTCCMPSQVSLR